MATRQERRERIVEIISRNRIDSQEQLQALLEVDGIVATQATVSRDMRDLGIMKTRRGYEKIDLDAISKADLRDLRRSLSDVRSAERAANVLVLKTPFGLAKPLAMKLDQAGLPHVVGSISGDDTIFIATRSASQAGELRRILQHLSR